MAGRCQYPIRRSRSPAETGCVNVRLGIRMRPAAPLYGFGAGEDYSCRGGDQQVEFVKRRFAFPTGDRTQAPSDA